jgi:hypothetical protein
MAGLIKITARPAPGRSQITTRATTPVWVQRMHAYGLPTTEVPSPLPLLTGSQRFIERWNRVSCGY